MLMNKSAIHSVGDVKRLGAILFVGAHPDDETFCCGGLLAAAAQNGQRVVCVTATRGEKGVHDESKWPADKLGQIREQELNAALAQLGVREHYMLSYADGACAQAGEDDAAQYVAEIIESCGIQTVITFGSDGLTGHPDHCAVSRWADAAVHISTRKPDILHIVQPREPYQKHLRAADKTLRMFFNVKKPVLAGPDDAAVYMTLDRDCLVRKYLAFKSMPSQMTHILAAIPPESFAGAFGVEALVGATDPRARTK